MSDTRIQFTKDGSPTLFSERFQETYHSSYGAWTETEHVYIREGLLISALNSNILRVGEIGLGSGLNAWATWQAAIQHNLNIDYFSIEAYPPDKEIIAQFNPSKLECENKGFIEMMGTLANVKFSPQLEFTFTWTQGLWAELNPFSELDVLYYDAFAPNTQPEMWTEVALKNAYQSLKSGGILVTYSAKGSVKRTLKSVGFSVENPPGAAGKIQMTRALKP